MVALGAVELTSVTKGIYEFTTIPGNTLFTFDINILDLNSPLR